MGIKPAIENLRDKLIDLTKRNKLLNYRNSKRSCVRVIEESHSGVLKKLLEGKSLTFKPLDLPTPKQLEDYEHETGKKKIPEAEHAESLGFNTSYELLGDTEDTGRSSLQTMLYPVDLERNLKKIKNDARIAIEEKGANMLFLAFGFLEYYEHDSSDTSHLAPLLLFPVSIERGSFSTKTNSFTYNISQTGDELSTNICLKELLEKELDLDLPDFDETTDIYDYFDSLETRLCENSRWKIKRYLTLSLFHFDKILMYHDLDPEKWPEDNSIIDNKLVNQFFAGQDAEGVSDLTFATEYDIEKIREEDYPIIYDADSSQHSAIIDVLKGQNTVIEGPPGTGKSQTITNVIAAALAKGKKVLFVAEKQAALKVVKHRLDMAGLGYFCLDMHNTNRQQKEVLEALRKRLAKYKETQLPSDYSAEKKHLKVVKNFLLDYSEIIGSEYKDFEMSVHDIFCNASLHRLKLTSFPEELHNVSFKFLENEDLFVENMVKLDAVLEDYKVAATALNYEMDRLDNHPWAAVRGANIRRFDKSRLVNHVKDVGNILADLDAQTATLKSKLKVECTSLKDIGSLLDQFSPLESLPDNEVFEICIQALKNSKGNTEAMFSQIQDVARHVRERQGALSELKGLFRADLSDEKMDAVKKFKQIIVNLGFHGSYSLTKVEEIKDDIEACISSLSKYKPIIDKVFERYSSVFPKNTLQTNYNVLKCIRIFSVCPQKSLCYRNSISENIAFTEVINKAYSEYRELEATRKELEEYFDFEKVEQVADLKQLLHELENESVSRFISLDWYKCKKQFKQILATSKQPKNDKKTDRLKALINYKKQYNDFNTNLGYQKSIGKLFDGILTPFEDIINLLEWYKQIRSSFSALNETEAAIAKFIIETPECEIEAIAQLITTNDIDTADSSFRTIKDLFDDIEEPLPSLEHFAHKLKLADEQFKNAELTEKVKSIKNIEDIVAKIEAIEELKFTIEEHVQRIIPSVEVQLDNYEQSMLRAGFDLLLSIKKAGLEAPLFDYITRTHSLDSYKELLNEINSLSERYCESNGKINYLASNFGFIKTPFMDIPVDDAKQAFDAMNNHHELLDEWLGYLTAVNNCKNKELQLFPELVESGKIKIEELISAFHATIFRQVAMDICSQNEVLDNSSSIKIEEYRRKFQMLDEKMLEYERLVIAQKIDKRTVVMAGNKKGPIRTWTEYALIKRELEKKTRHVPVRQLIARAKKSIQALMPCFMMSPLSVAQYLGRDNFKFDLVVMDEASQMRPECAIGAIARAKQMVIVGDPKQLPPTSFFDKMMDEEDEDLTALEDSESILESAASYCESKRCLKWHYRSRHESLIAFSNYHFYNNELIVFPSPHAESDELGIKFNYIEDSVYSSGKNEKEAQEVVAAIIRHKKEKPKESLGVVTLNNSQKLIIENEIEKICKKDSFVRGLFNKTNEAEPFFVKNLENVQGDERDTIFISITYGRNHEGRVFQNFGPINKKNGWRRLNVLFTRAKKRVEIFTSLKSHDIVIKDNSSKGLQALRNYLKFAEEKIIEDAKNTDREPDSPFEVSVIDALENRGYNIKPQIGVAGFYIDLAVEHPTMQGKYILGIECDGASYHSAKSVRDRDRLRQSILENLGWKIHRIWSTDWFYSPAKEIEKVIQKIDDCIKEDDLLTNIKKAPETIDDLISAQQPLGNDDFDEDVCNDYEDETFTADEARRELEKLKCSPFYVEAGENYTDILAEGMIQQFLFHVPTNIQELLSLSTEVRSQIDPDQVDTVLPEIFEILKRVDKLAYTGQ